MFFEPISFCQGKNSQQHTPSRRCMWTKVIWDFVYFFSGMLFAWQKIGSVFFILSLEHHWRKKPKHSRSHLNEPKFDWSWKCAFFVVEIDRPHEHCASKCSIDFFPLNKQTVVYALDRCSLSNGRSLFPVRCVCWHGKKLPGGRQIHDLNLCNWKWPNCFLFSVAGRAAYDIHKIQKMKQRAMASRVYNICFHEFISLFFSPGQAFLYVVCKATAKKDNFDIRILLIHHEN